jgi:hypothetical protein
MENLKREIQILVKGNLYPIKFPNVGQFLDIEKYKVIYSGERYNGLISAVTGSAYKALDFIDMFANLQVLAPQLIKDIKAENIFELDLFDANELLQAYKKQVEPWINSWQKLLSNPMQLVEDNKSETQNNEAK